MSNIDAIVFFPSFLFVYHYVVLISEKIGCSVEHDALVKEFMHGFMHENALNPMIYPSLRSVI